MQVKIFEAKDMASGLKMVKEALGPEALILSTRTVRGGGFGILGKPMLEITAAVDNGLSRKDIGAAPAQAAGRAGLSSRPGTQPPPEPDLSYASLWQETSPAWQQTAGPEPGAFPRYEAAAAMVSPDGGKKQRRPDNPAAADQRLADLNPELHRELTELRGIVKNLSGRMTRFDTSPLRRPYVEPEFILPGEQNPDNDPVSAFLTGYGINAETARMLSRFTRDNIRQHLNLDAAGLRALLMAAMTRLFATKNYLEAPGGGRRILSLIGPTGVGKTTTLAKIAAHHLSRFGGRTALITIDTYRIAAVEQLKVYGEIMHLPVEVVLKPSDLDRALEKFRDCDLILIDTAGRSPKNGLDLQELASFLQPHPEIENTLLLPASARELELEEAIRCFGILPISSLVFTKIDECAQLGVLLNIHYKNDIPISFLTNGQRVPEDLLCPSPADIAGLIMNDHNIERHG